MSSRDQSSRGIIAALAAATVSGVAVFVNSYGVRAVADATVYTTAKNLVAAAILTLATIWLLGLRRSPARLLTGSVPTKPDRASSWPMLARWQQRVGLTAVAVIGGSVPFVLFFEGLAKASSTQAQFLHKTLVIWVAVLAVSLLGERLHAAHVVAIAALVVGQAVLGGGVAAIRPGTGELLILAATLLWSVEVVLAKRLLAQLRPTTVALARMAGGAVVLVGWVVASGRLPTLVGLSPTGWLWAAATGTLLAGYVALWFTALVRVGAIDVTAVLVLAVPVTAGLNIAVKGTSLTPAGSVGLLLLATGVLIVVAAAMLRRPRKLELVG